MTKAGSKRWGAWLLAVTVAVIWLPATATAANGLGPGVHVDPGSPAAKEYSIPLGAARGNGQSGSSSPASLFGQGITPVHTVSTNTARPTTPSSSPAAAAAHHPRQATSHRSHRNSHQHRSTAGAAQPGGGTGSGPGSVSSLSPAREIGTSSGGGTGITWMLGAAVAVLLLGVLGGSVLARRDRRTSQPNQAAQTGTYIP